LNVRDLILKNLSATIEIGVVDALLDNYEKVVSRLRSGDLDGSLSAAGKFVEHTLRAIEYIRTGSAPTENKAPQQTVKDIEKDQRLPEGLRLLMPRIAHAMVYDIRSKRGAIHVKEIDPRQIDAALSAQAASWILAELLRMYHADDETTVSLALESLMRPHIPWVERFGDEDVVTRDVPCELELLMLLARAAPKGLDRSVIGQSSKYRPPTVTSTLQKLDKARYVHRTRDGRYHVTGPGQQRMTEQLIASASGARNTSHRRRAGRRRQGTYARRHQPTV
jgi:hypothetical protein